MRRDPFLLDQPIQHQRRSVGGIGSEALWLEAEVLFGSGRRGVLSAQIRLLHRLGAADGLRIAAFEDASVDHHRQHMRNAEHGIHVMLNQDDGVVGCQSRDQGGHAH